MGQTKSKLIELEEKGLLTNPNYKAFWEKKQEIKSKYSESLWKYAEQGRPNQKKRNAYIQSEHEEYKKYLKEITDIILSPNSDFQKFVWDIIPDYKIELMEQRARGRKPKNDMS